jgi:hypothetical protein
MSDQERRNPQHSNPQKPHLVQKPGNQPEPPVQEKHEFPSGQPKRPQSEREKQDALAVVIRGWLVRQ